MKVLKRVLLTGGTGFIGSHTAVILVEAGFEVILLDNLCNSKVQILEQLKKIIGYRPIFVEGDIRNSALVEQTINKYKISSVIHFAGLKAVGESVSIPITYYDNNLAGTISLLKAMQATNIYTIIFSSSSTVYGIPQYLPYDEAHPTSAINPYGQSKIHIENILSDLAKSDSQWRICSLRYFNPIGAHSSGLIGEDPNDLPNNLLPYIAQVATGKLPHLNIFGNDYATEDGTGVRDYIHVIDLAEGHLAALKFLNENDGWHVFNLGTGTGYSVLEIVKAFEKASGKKISYKYAPRRAGDLAKSYASSNKAKKFLGWQAKRNLEDMCQSVWNFQSNKI